MTAWDEWPKSAGLYDMVLISSFEYPGEVYGLLAWRTGIEDHEALKFLTLGVISYGLCKGTMVAGDLNDEGLQPWACDLGTTIDRIARGLADMHKKGWMIPGLICWLGKTDEGNRQADKHTYGP